MDFAHSPKVKDLGARLTRFMDDNVYPAEPAFAAEVEDNRKRGNPWVATKVMEGLKTKARAAGLWNLFLPESDLGAGLTNLEYAPLCEIMGRSWIAPETFNCNAPDTGNMEVLVRYGTDAQKKEWLEPLLARRDPLGLRDDRAGCRVVGRDQHRGVDRPRRRPLRDQRAQMVDDRRPRSALQDPHLHGQDRRREPRPPPAAVDDPRSGRHARRAPRARAPGVRLRRRTAWTRGVRFRQRSRAGGRTSCSARVAASRSRRGASGPAASTTACALSARPSDRSRQCAGARRRA